MSPAVRFLEELVFGHRLNYAGHPVLAWQLSCVAILEVEAGNVRFSKKRSKGKIDAVIALAMAAIRARLLKSEPVAFTTLMALSCSQAHRKIPKGRRPEGNGAETRLLRQVWFVNL
jgi:phage terminase large subunit-like protein